ncbi:MAG: hypothetical protein ABWU16_05575 [Halothiobacillaceae bacterium]
MFTRSMIISATLALAMTGGVVLPTQADEPQLNQDRLQQQIREHAMTQQNLPDNGRPMGQMRQDRHEIRSGNHSSDMGHGGMGHRGMGGEMGAGRGGR